MGLALFTWLISLAAMLITSGGTLRVIVIICMIFAFIGIGIHFIVNSDAIIRNKYVDK